jgi:aldehyde dehydrogenase (NAD+)
MSGFPKDGLARSFLAGRWAEGDDGAVIAIEDPGTQEPSITTSAPKTSQSR